MERSGKPRIEYVAHGVIVIVRMCADIKGPVLYSCSQLHSEYLGQFTEHGSGAGGSWL